MLGGGRQQQNTEALSGCSPCPGRSLYCTHPSTRPPTVHHGAPWEGGGRGNHRWDPVTISPSRPPHLCAPDANSPCLHSDLTPRAGETCTLKVGLSLLTTSTQSEVGARPRAAGQSGGQARQPRVRGADRTPALAPGLWEPKTTGEVRSVPNGPGEPQGTRVLLCKTTLMLSK